MVCKKVSCPACRTHTTLPELECCGFGGGRRGHVCHKCLALAIDRAGQTEPEDTLDPFR